MTEMITTGAWTVTPDHEERFVQAWQTFADWASRAEGAGALRLARDTGKPGTFISFGLWDRPQQVRDWKSGPEFRERIARVLQYVDNFQPSELELVAERPV